MKRKKFSEKSVVAQKKQHDNNALSRLHDTCNLLVGNNIFSIFDQIDRNHLLAMRFEAVKLNIETASSIKNVDAIEYQKAFLLMLSGNHIDTLLESRIPLNVFLREGLTLIRYVELNAKFQAPGYTALKKAFEPWIDRGKFYQNTIFKIVGCFQAFGKILRDWRLGLFVINVDGLALFKLPTKGNCVECHLEKLPTINLFIDGNVRKALAIGWPDLNGGIQHCLFSSKQLGSNEEDLQQIKVYIQEHALTRLQERLGIVPGIVHKAIFDLITLGSSDFHLQDDSIFLPLVIYNCKLGYLVCKMISDKLLIRTFLFITNDGTPEGKEFNKLTRLAKLDKSYLKIDSLNGFLGLNINPDSSLHEILRLAGCAGLLDLKMLRPFYRYEVTNRSDNELVKYLMAMSG